MEGIRDADYVHAKIVYKDSVKILSNNGINQILLIICQLLDQHDKQLQKKKKKKKEEEEDVKLELLSDVDVL